MKTTLEVAVDFCMALEARKVATFDLRPDPAITTRPSRQEGQVLTGMPTSQYVSDENALEWGWTGNGAMYESVIMPKPESSARAEHHIELERLRISADEGGGT